MKAQFVDRRLSAQRQRLPHRGQGLVLLRVLTRTPARRTSATSTRSSTRASSSSCRRRRPTGSSSTRAAATPTARSEESDGATRTTSATRRRWSRSTRSTWARSSASCRSASDLSLLHPPGLPDHRRHVLVPGQLHGRAIRSTCSTCGRARAPTRWTLIAWSTEPDRRGIQCRVVARAAVLPEPGLHQQLRVQGPAAGLGRRPHVPLLRGGAGSWLTQHDCRPGCTTRPTSRATSRRRAGSTRTCIGLAAGGDLVREGRAVRQGAHLLPRVLRPRRRQRAGVLPVREPGGRRSCSVRRCRPRRSTTSRCNVEQGDAGGDRAAAQGRRATRSRQSYVLEHGYCRSVYVDRPERDDRRVHAGSPGRREDQRRTPPRTRTASSSAGWPATTPRTTCSAERPPGPGRGQRRGLRHGAEACARASRSATTHASARVTRTAGAPSADAVEQLGEPRGLARAGHEPQPPPRAVERRQRQRHAAQALVFAAQRHVAVRDLEHRVARHERGGVAVGAEAELHEVERSGGPASAARAVAGSPPRRRRGRRASTGIASRWPAGSGPSCTRICCEARQVAALGRPAARRARPPAPPAPVPRQVDGAQAARASATASRRR